MDKRRWIPSVILVLALFITGFALFQQTGENMTFYYEVDEVDRREIGDRVVKISGDVAAGSIERFPGKSMVRFDVAGETNRYTVEYTGVVPDIFKDGIQVVARGSFDGRDVFVADDLLAKCPSKYQPEANPDDFAHLSEHPTGISVSTE